MFDRTDACSDPATERDEGPQAWRLHRLGRFRGRPGEVAYEGGAGHVALRHIEEGRGVAWIDGVARKLAAGDLLLVHRGASVQLCHDAMHPLSGTAIDCSGPLIDQLLAAYGLLGRSHLTQAAVGPAIRSLQALAADPAAAQRRAGLALHELLARLGERAGDEPDLPEVVRIGKAYIDDNADAPLRLADVARQARCSEAHLSRMFRRFLGVPPGDYGLRQRMAVAKRLLGTTDAPIKSIASRLGYRDTFAFSHAFKNVEGTAPTLWRAAGQGARGLARAS